MLLEAYEKYIPTIAKDMGDRSKTVGASEIGLCARQTFWVKNQGTPRGVEPDEDFKHDWGARERGNLIEKHFWVPALRLQYGDNLLYAGDEQMRFVKGSLSATPDGLLINQPYDAMRHVGIKDIKSECFTVEGKTVDPRTNLVEAKEQHIYQINTQIGMLRDATPYKPQYGLLTYTDASFFSEVDEFAVQYDPQLFQAAQDRAAEIMQTKNGSDLAPEGWITGGKECSFCAFTKACGVERRGVPKGQNKPTTQFTAEITDAAKDYNAIKLEINDRQTKLKTMEVDIKARLRSKGVRRIQNVVNWYEVSAPVRYQNKEIRQAFAELGGDCDDYMTIGEPSDRFVVSATPTEKKVVTPGKRRKSKVKATKTKKPAKKTKAPAKRKK